LEDDAAPTVAENKGNGRKRVTLSISPFGLGMGKPASFSVTRKLREG